MSPLFTKFRGKPTWVETGKLKLPSYGKTVEVTTYSDGDILFWDSLTNVSVGFEHAEVEKLKKLLNAMKPPVVKAKVVDDGYNRPEPVPVKSVFDVPKPPAVIQHKLEDQVAPTVPKVKIIEVKDVPPPVVKYPVTREITVKHINLQPTPEFPPDIISPSFRDAMKKKLMDASTADMMARLNESYIKDEVKPIAKSIKETLANAPIASKAPKVEATKPQKAEVKIERSVKKEDAGWGSNVLVNGKQVRWYYKTRDLARLSLSIHRIGDKNGRIS